MLIMPAFSFMHSPTAANASGVIANDVVPMSIAGLRPISPRPYKEAAMAARATIKPRTLFLT